MLFGEALDRTRRRAQALQFIPKILATLDLPLPKALGDCRNCPSCLYRHLDPPYCCDGRGIEGLRAASENRQTVWEGILRAWFQNLARSEYRIIQHCGETLSQLASSWPGG